MTTLPLAPPPSEGKEEAQKYFYFGLSDKFLDLTPSMQYKKMRDFSLFILQYCSRLKKNG